MEKCNDPKWASEQLTEKEAIDFAKSKVWEKWTHEQIVRFQLFQKRLAIDFGKFHEALEAVLKRPVFTHELAYIDNIKREYLGEKEMPTLDEIINLIPAEKRIIINFKK